MPYQYKNEYRDYRDKQAILSDRLHAVTPREFYDDIFPDEDLERPGHPEDHKANVLMAIKEPGRSGKPRFTTWTLHAGKEGLEKAYKADFALCGLCTYSGRRRLAKNAWKCYGIAIDLDGVGKEQIENLLYGITAKITPCPQYIVNSGHGLHLYYLFENPVPLFPSVRAWLPRLKTGLTKIVWSNNTSYIQSNPSKDQRDYLPIYQQMRMPGSCSKIGKGKSRTKYLVSAFRWNSYPGARCSFAYLNGFLEFHGLYQYKVPEDPDYASWDYEHLSLEEARQRFPEWYQKRIVEGKPAGQWVCSRGLYHWWLDRIKKYDPSAVLEDWENGARDGNRYHCVCVLFAMAVKCGIPLEEVKRDALALVPDFNDRTEKADNPFTEQDVEDAASYYKPESARMSARAITDKTKLKWEKPRRNGRKQAAHLERMRVLRSLETYDNVGRPSKADQVKAWREANPQGSKNDCIRETGISKPTVYKWWDG